MKKPVSIILIPAVAVLFLSCGSTKEKAFDGDSVILPDADNSEYDDDFSELDEDSDKTDEDFNDFDNEPETLSFKTRPHGITKWDETYNYFIRCESERNSETVITVSKDDTCKGTIESDTYTFTPTKAKFPDGRCSIVVECSNGEKVIKQKSAIQIPNPFELPRPVGIKPSLKFLWSNSNRGVFIYEKKLYSINRNLDTIQFVSDDIMEATSSDTIDSYYYKTDEFLYYISKDKKGILKTDGTTENTEKIIISGDLNLLHIPLATDKGSMVLRSYDSEKGIYSVWFYDYAKRTAKKIELPENFISFAIACDNKDCIFESPGKGILIFRSSNESLEQICPGITDINSWDLIFQNGIIYHRGYGDTCLTSLNILTCSEKEIGNCENSPDPMIIIREKGKNYFHTIKNDEKTEITFFSFDGSVKTEVFDDSKIYNFTTNDGIHLQVFQYSPGNSDKPYKCLKTLNLEDGSIITHELSCNFGSGFEPSGYFGETALFSKFYGKLDPQFFEISNTGTVSEKLMNVEMFPTEFSVSSRRNLNGKMNLIYSMKDLIQIFETDGTLENTKFITTAPGAFVSIAGTLVITHVNDEFLNIYSLTTRELLKSGCALPCEITYRNGTKSTYPGIRTTGLIKGNREFFETGISSYNCENSYAAWSTDGTLEGTVKHPISSKYALSEVYHGHEDSENGLYLNMSYDILYIDKDNNVIESGLSEYYSLGIFNDTMIAYKYDDDYSIKETVSLRKGKIVDKLTGDKNRKIFRISKFKNGIKMLESVSNEEQSSTRFLFFPDGDLNKEPVTAELFAGYYSSVSQISEIGNKIIFSIPDDNDGWTKWYYLITVTVNDDESVTVSEPFYRYYDSNSDDFEFVAVSGSNILFSKKEKLYSVPFNKGLFPSSGLVQDGLEFRFSGYAFSGEAVIQYRDHETNHFLILTDGRKDNLKLLEKNYSEEYNYDVWNGWIVEKGRKFIIEEKGNTLNTVSIFGDGSGNISSGDSKPLFCFSKQNEGQSTEPFLYRFPVYEEY